MAKKTVYVPQASGQDEEMVVTVVRFRGSGESMRKGFDALSQAFAAFGTPAAAPRALNGRKATPQLPATDALDADAVNVETPDETEPESEAEEAAATPRVKKEPGKPKYSFLADFNLAPDGVPSLVDFCTPKNATGEQDRYLIVSLWLQTHGATDPFTGNHVFSCFRALGWKARQDVMQPAREMKARKSWYDSPSYGKWRLTQPGIKAAEAVGQA